MKPFKRAIVTGATSGIGAATVRALCTEGFHTLAIARRRDPLEELSAETGCEILAADIADIDAIKDKIVAFDADVVVNNAGVGHGLTGLADLSSSQIANAFAVNAVALVQITALALEGMKRRNCGHIVNIGSIAGLHTIASAVYGASKSAVHIFSQNLRFELSGTGVRVTEVCPGRVNSAFYENAAGDDAKLAAMMHTGIAELQPDDISRTIMFALQAPPHVNISTIELLPTEQVIGGAKSEPAPGITLEETAHADT